MRIIPILIYCALSIAAVAQQHDHTRMEAAELGKVHFETSCAPQAQEGFDRAVALLHSFQFGRARAAFQSVLKDDPKCAIVYWGLGLVEWSNPFAPGMRSESQLNAGRQAAQSGMELIPKTKRECSYIAAVARLYADADAKSQQARVEAYRDAMADVSAKHPEDHEAAIFYALSLAEAEPLGDKTHAQRLKAGAILEKLYVQEPSHPGLAHYIIHAYDVPDLAGKALDAARRYSKIAPDAPHALHMPSHTFTRVGLWQESIESNIAAETAAQREHQYAEQLHAIDYQMYAYLQTAQDEAARKLLQSVPAIVDQMKSNQVSGGAAPPAAGYFALAAIPARYALERNDWQLAASLQSATTTVPYADAITWFARGLAAARLKQLPRARETYAALQMLGKKMQDAHEDYWAGQVEIQRLEVGAWIHLATDNSDAALKTMKDAVALEDNTDKSAITPGPLVPARELLGEMLLRLGKPKLALEQFELTLKKEPGRFRALYGAGHAAKLAGDAETSRKYFAQLLNTCERADKPSRPELAEALAETNTQRQAAVQK
ncbi:MAG: hypothetical protein JWO13_1400 [Acidobacteriales bacterium]|nr:hypothetical protein [Terriglobales bacterium]